MKTSTSCFSVFYSLLGKIKMHCTKKEKEKRPPKHYYQIQSNFTKKTPKGFVPIIVGLGKFNGKAGKSYGYNGEEIRFLVHVKLLTKPWMLDLLELAARQFGYDQQGVLRVPCDARHFQKVLDSFSVLKKD